MSYSSYSDYIKTLEAMADQCRELILDASSFGLIGKLKEVNAGLEGLRYDAIKEELGGEE